MAVFRIEKNKDFTIMSNHHLRNQSLSLKAKGLQSLMLSLPESWDFTLAGFLYQSVPFAPLTALSSIEDIHSRLTGLLYFACSRTSSNMS